MDLLGRRFLPKNTPLFCLCGSVKEYSGLVHTSNKENTYPCTLLRMEKWGKKNKVYFSWHVQKIEVSWRKRVQHLPGSKLSLSLIIWGGGSSICSNLQWLRQRMALHWIMTTRDTGPARLLSTVNLGSPVFQTTCKLPILLCF